MVAKALKEEVKDTHEVVQARASKVATTISATLKADLDKTADPADSSRVTTSVRVAHLNCEAKILWDIHEVVPQAVGMGRALLDTLAADRAKVAKMDSLVDLVAMA